MALRWVRGVDIFAMDYLFVPINDDMHWSLAVVCNPAAVPVWAAQKAKAEAATRAEGGGGGESAMDVEGGEEAEAEEVIERGCIMLFDSLKCHHSQTVTKNLRL
jgi:sentrin-specific protease 7